jgi:hypothetical protein
MQTDKTESTRRIGLSFCCYLKFKVNGMFIKNKILVIVETYIYVCVCVFYFIYGIHIVALVYYIV